MNISITKEFKFEAAHQLSLHEGKCKNLHGHSYRLQVTVSGPLIESGPSTGMVLDFSDLTQVVKSEIINQWDHQFLNDILPFTTTAENLALECLKRIKDKDIPVTSVTLYETAKCSATVSL